MFISWLRREVVLNVECVKEAGPKSGFFVVQNPSGGQEQQAVVGNYDPPGEREGATVSRLAVLV
jgi:hypothetical protein